MSETEDIRAVVENNDFQSIVEGESGRSSSVDYLDTLEDVPRDTSKHKEEQKEEEVKEKVTVVEDEKSVIEAEKKEATQPACPGTPSSPREEAGSRVGATGTTDGRNETAPVGEWNSLPVLVDRLRTALELSLATGSRPDDETPAVPEDSGVDSEEDFRIRTSMEQVLGDCKEPEIRKDLKFLEDLLLSDIQTALSRLRETLERIDVAALAKHGAASDPSSKLHLLRLVSSLLSRLQLPEEVPEKTPVFTVSRRRRGTRHTIGVSTEELARARKWLEEERNCLPLDEVVAGREVKEQVNSTLVVEKKPEEVRDKCTKDAINQRQLLEDKNKEILENGAYRVVQQVEGDVRSNGESNMCQEKYRHGGYEGKENNEEEIEINEERNRVSKLAAALRQRAELAVSGGRYGGNKFSAKKSKIKRANTIDIPSYLKLQAESLGHETTGCISLRRPINVGDKAAFNAANAIVPTFQPKTENDRKFLALINKNNEPPPAVPVAPFKVSGLVKNMDMSSKTDKNWNSRFSNIKTTFDKPSGNEDSENKSSLKSRANKWFSQTPQTYESSSNFNPPPMKVESASGFRHAPSSPFRKIEKSSATSPSKVPAPYHWKNPTPTNTLREKARMMFDRENVQPSSKSRSDIETQEKHGFPRPPWIDQERNEGKANGTVTENGRLDYRSFCKQFAPFVGKGSVESKKQEEQRQKHDRMPGVVDGKFSFKMIPDKHAQRHQYPPIDRREVRQKFEPKNTFEVIKSGYERRYSEGAPKIGYPDATLRGSSSVAVQTGVNDDHQDEGRSFRVAPKISKGSNLVCSNASVQTTSDLDRPTISVSDVDAGKQWTPLCYEKSDSELASDSVYRSNDRRQSFVLDHNQNYHTVPSDPELSSPLTSQNRQVPSDQGFRDNVSFQPIQSHQKQGEDPVKKESFQPQNREVLDYTSFVSPSYDRSKEVLKTREQNVADWPIESSSFPDDQNIQNQDISPEVGVVTRYTCAIATVASSVDSPEPRSEEVAADSRTSSSPSPSQFSWSRSRPPTNERATPEEEIRRHNLLQQSIARRLQNEVTSLNEPAQQVPSPNYGQHLSVNQSRSLNQPQTTSQPSIFHQPNYNQPANFDPPVNHQESSRVGKFLAPVPQKKPEPPPTHSPGPVSATRVGALRDAYELAPSTQTKPIQKERSPIPNGATQIDSSDEYLVSCATKPSRSIVLSKSESWHQLALSNSYPRAPRVNVPASTSSNPPSHPKPPKPRSPSSQKLRSKQFEASSMADSVKKMEDKIRQYFDHPAEVVETREISKHRRSPRVMAKGMVRLSRSRTMPGLSDDKLRLLIPAPQQAPLLNVNTADVDKVFDDLFEEATRTDGQQC